MHASFESIHNIHETAVIEAVRGLRAEYPAVTEDLLPDVACVALNRLPSRYIRHSVDLAFYQSEREREELAALQQQTVRQAFEFVQARCAMRARR